ncbi:MAG: S41 family peptidase [Thermodesulfovibrionia bacterium]|nr:S41 family peptidase [Thermodesulfovibrionia bacterium]
MYRHKRVILWIALILIVLSVYLIGALNVKNVGAKEPYEKIKIFAEVLSIVKKNYVDTIEEDKNLIYGAIKGMLNSLDPHSAFMSPDVFKEMQIDTKGEFGGLGIKISIKDEILTVISPIEDTPAYRAGVKAGDKIIKINKESTKNMNLHDAVTKLRGPKGTSVTITILREELEKPKEITIVRDIIKIRSVKSKVMDGNIGYVKLLQFQQKTGSELAKALKSIEKEEINDLILDLRNNPGGLLNSAIDVANQFLPSHTLVVYIKGRDEEKIEYKTTTGRKIKEYPMIILVNEGSASASEIVAGALQDWEKAVILGAQTFGKGSVQTVIPLSDGSGLRLTTARYYTPKGRSIQATGIEPDIVVKPKTKGKEKTHPVIREKDLEKHLENDQTKDSEKDQDKEKGKNNDIEKEKVIVEVSEEEDVQLQMAIDLLKTWRVFKQFPKAG